ncbi:NAD(P)-binding domain-containing protein [Nonomuraea basaltis]|uniref:NAD(P)-binding domain-containing protein n=1 Tax=Nonomuraea basaltis TaxID=2495887 RepID=UPI00110C5C70|nr:NAD(P)-binding domain-containing protein [Nonomuraea basaltis]TMR97429.1 cupin domain-containing protein [Nonomuraea basaltis]
MTALAWIGLGAMGARMARRLVDAGHEVTVWNRTSARTDALAAAGARVAATPAEAVRRAEVVFLMLADPAALQAVTEGPGGVASGVGAGATVVDMSTVGPLTLARLWAALPPAVAVLDVPVLGSLAEAEAGTLTLLAGGPAEAVARVRPPLSALGELVHLGPAGTGAAAKLVANFALLGMVGLLGEALAIADGLGLPREVTWRVLDRTPLAAQAARRRPAIESGAFAPRFALALARKDADLVVTAADEAGADIRLARAVRSWLADAESDGLQALDYTAVLRHITSPPGRPEHTGTAVTAADVPGYSWGDGCAGWRLVDTPGLSVIEERMPPGTAEEWHVHDRARQFFYVLDGEATMRTPDGDVSLPVGAGVEIAPGTPHQLNNIAAGDLRFLVVSAPTTRGDRRALPGVPGRAGDLA